MRAEPGVFGSVASDATISRTIARLAADADRVLAAIAAARAVVREQAWRLAGRSRSPPLESAVIGPAPQAALADSLHFGASHASCRSTAADRMPALRSPRR